MIRRSLSALKTLLTICTLALIVGSGTLVAPTSAAAEETCFAPSFGILKCSETFVLNTETYEQEVTDTQSCQNGKSPHAGQQTITTLETRQVTEYQTLTSTYSMGNLIAVDESWETVEVVLNSETVDIGKCRKVRS